MGNNLQPEKRKISLDYQSLDIVTPKEVLARLICISPSSLSRYHKLAKVISADYREDDKAHRFLTRFMCWVLWHISYKHAELRSTRAAEVAIAEIAKALTKEEFEKQQRRQRNKDKINFIGA